MMTAGELWRRIWYAVNRERASAELEEEMRLHRELRAERLRAGGAADPTTDARRRFGNATVLAERSRDAWGLQWIEHAAADARFALRRLKHRPAFALSTIAVLALGIGATTAVFSAVDAALIRPLPFLRPSELVTLNNVRIPSSSQSRRTPGDPHSVDVEMVASMTDLSPHSRPEG
jgi:hypothetical protein